MKFMAETWMANEEILGKCKWMKLVNIKAVKVNKIHTYLGLDLTACDDNNISTVQREISFFSSTTFT